MLRNRSRTMTGKEALTSEQTSFLSPTKNSSFLNSPRFLNGFLSKTVFDAETMSPTSILDSNISPNFSNPFVCDSKPRPVTEAIGLALIDSIIDEKLDQDNSKFPKPVNRLALLGSKLKVQIPELNGSPPEPGSPRSPADFGIKTRSPFGVCSPAKDLSRQLSLKEMEESEDYTCVITHGPNPKTTHIYDDCVVDSCCLELDSRDSGFRLSPKNRTGMEFLTVVAKDSKDVYICRGEKGFCREECGCHCQEMNF